MHSPRNHSLLVFAAVAALSWPGGVAVAPGGQAADRSQSAKPNRLKQRIVRPKPAAVEMAADVVPDLVILKFSEGTHVRLVDGKLVSGVGALSRAEEKLLKRNKLDHDTVDRELGDVNAYLSSLPGITLASLFSRPDDDLFLDQGSGQLATREELADLSLYFALTFKDPKVARDVVLKVANTLNVYRTLEFVGFQPTPIEAGFDLPPFTPDISAVAPGQGYLAAAPGGIDSVFAMTLPGGDGQRVRVLDVESGWNLDHEDLPGEDEYTRAAGDNVAGRREHGTAVLGVIGAQNNQYGVVGVASRATLGVSSIFSGGSTVPVVANAISMAMASLRAGDVLLIQEQYTGSPHGVPCTGGFCEQLGSVPVESLQADYDVIRTATANGVIVVEVAGNGGMNLDEAFYGDLFDRARFDSGAIIVGAGISGSATPAAWTNSGRRVDVQAWGDRVMTLGSFGVGDIRINGSDVRQFYTTRFAGTSSAAAIVAGAVAAIQGVVVAGGRSPLTPAQMRTLLVSTGTPQAADPRHVGPQPDLRAAVTSLSLHPIPPRVWPAIEGRRSEVALDVGRNADGRLEVFAAATDGFLYHSAQAAPGIVFGSWLRVGSGTLQFRGRPSVVSNADGRLEVFARTTDDAIGHAWQMTPGGAFTDWSTFGGVWNGDPEAAVNADGRLEVFVRGRDSALWHLSQVVAGGLLWSPFTSLGGSVANAVTTARDSFGRMEVFVRASDATIRRIAQGVPGGEWSAWTVIMTGASGDPRAIHTPSGRVTVLVRVGNQIAVSEELRSGFGPFLAAGVGSMPAAGRVAVAIDRAGLLEVFVRSTDNSVRHATKTGRTWSAWTSLDGDLFGFVAVGVNADGRLEVFGNSSDERIVHVAEPF